MVWIQIEQVSKRLGETLAVDRVDLQIQAGELFFLLGPSGCGKTTLLNLIAGLIEPTQGRILFDGQDVTQLPTHRRNAVMCFQSYALWPHLSVAENVRFGLDVRRLARPEQEERVRAALELVRMSPYRERKPAELSGGQQQRVAIARAVAVQPACLLLDEPLSNLDTRLRQQMRGEIRSICKATGLTTLYVTHDQKEALSVADRIAILDAGRIVQVGTPRELYSRPANAFVAEFLGQANLVPGRILERALAPAGSLSSGAAATERLLVDTPLGRLVAFAQALPKDAAQVTLSIRPEQLAIAPQPAAATGGDNRVRAQLLESDFLGDSSEHRVSAGGLTLRLHSVPPRFDLPQELTIVLAPEELVVLGGAG
ncbi:MAG TPA: ABC transporter ATP-binding protein [Polyangiaceae bacterium]|nr:ABC transporter ATP-binding protein [Polyangiaceae bacterium]